MIKKLNSKRNKDFAGVAKNSKQSEGGKK